MNATCLPAPVPANHNAQPIHLDLYVADPEVAHELGQRCEGRERNDYATGALRLGVLALRQASGALDAQTIQREGDRLLGSVRELLVERTGQVTLDDPESPLFRMKREMRDVLDGMATSNAQFQTEVRATLEAFKARREEAARSTRHGNTFEACVGEFLQREAQRLGDVYEAVGTLKGQIDRKTGDHVVTLGAESGAPGARIVCEAKARKGYTERGALDEIARARKNRDAKVGLVVMDRAIAPDGIEALRRVGDDVLLVWDADDVASDLVLRLGVSVARAWCVRELVAESAAEASLEQIDESIESIANQIRVLDEIIHSGKLIKRRGEKVVSSGERLRETLEREVAALQQHVKALRRDGR